MAEQITLIEMLKAIGTGDPFSCIYVTYDGKFRYSHEIKEAVMIQQDSLLRISQIDRPLTPNEQKIMELIKDKNSPGRHMILRLLDNGSATRDIRKISYHSIVVFNNKEVVI